MRGKWSTGCRQPQCQCIFCKFIQFFVNIDEFLLQKEHFPWQHVVNKDLEFFSVIPGFAHVNALADTVVEFWKREMKECQDNSEGTFSMHKDANMENVETLKLQLFNFFFNSICLFKVVDSQFDFGFIFNGRSVEKIHLY